MNSVLRPKSVECFTRLPAGPMPKPQPFLPCGLHHETRFCFLIRSCSWDAICWVEVETVHGDLFCLFWPFGFSARQFIVAINGVLSQIRREVTGEMREWLKRLRSYKVILFRSRRWTAPNAFGVEPLKRMDRGLRGWVGRLPTEMPPRLRRVFNHRGRRVHGGNLDSLLFCLCDLCGNRTLGLASDPDALQSAPKSEGSAV